MLSKTDAMKKAVKAVDAVAHTDEPRKMNAKDLLGINVNAATESKNGLTYLSWAWAWTEVLKVDPDANFKIQMFDGSPLMSVGGSYMVWVDVVIFGKTMTAFLPVLDYRNKPIAMPSCFDVNTSIMRCLAKGIALHGLGLYIYAGEDLPMESKKESDVSVVVEGKTYRDQEVEWDNSDASRTLFAEGIIQYADHCKTDAGLKSYWLNNQLQLESLKKTHPSLYGEVLAYFKAAKEKISPPAAVAASTETPKE